MDKTPKLKSSLSLYLTDWTAKNIEKRKAHFGLSPYYMLRKAVLTSRPSIDIVYIVVIEIQRSFTEQMNGVDFFPDNIAGHSGYFPRGIQHILLVEI